MNIAAELMTQPCAGMLNFDERARIAFDPHDPVQQDAARGENERTGGQNHHKLGQRNGAPRYGKPERHGTNAASRRSPPSTFLGEAGRSYTSAKLAGRFESPLTPEFNAASALGKIHPASATFCSCADFQVSVSVTRWPNSADFRSDVSFAS